ncbi:glycosyltransferase family 2 protein [Echinicola sediminis]
MSKVSIIIPIYNYGFVLEETLQNLLEQSYKDWEAIIVDDGSTDNSKEIVHDYVKVDDRIIYVYQENKGVSAARNVGLNLAKGEFIQFLDGDDLLSKDKLTLQVQHLENNPEIDISYTNSQYFENGNQKVLFPDKEMLGNEWMHKIHGRGFKTIKTLVDQNIAVISSPLFRGSLLKASSRFPENTPYLEDWEFWIELAFKNFSYHYFENPDAYTLIRVHPKSASFDMLPMRKRDLVLREKLNDLIKSSSLNQSEKEDLLALNRKQTDGIFKGLIYNTPFWNIKQLLKLKNLPHNKSFYILYCKSINYHRKQLIKSWKK